MIKPSLLALMSALLFFVSPSAQTQTIQVLHTFGGGTDGRFPNAGLTADGKGNFYGTTQGGGAFGNGTVFKLSPNGSGGWNETVIYNFCSAPNCPDGTDGRRLCFTPLRLTPQPPHCRPGIQCSTALGIFME